MEGWIKLHRKMIDNPVSQKPNYLAVWIYLLSYANHSDKEIIWNNQKTLVKKGSFIGSMRKIAEHYNIGIATVKYIIDYLVVEQMIEHKPNSKFSLFTIKNYCKYQEVEHTIEHKVNTSRTQGETTKNDNNEKNDKNIIEYNNKQSFGNVEINDLFNYWEELFSYKISTKVQLNRNVAHRLIGKYGIDKIRGYMKASAVIQGENYAPTITNFIDLEQKLPNLAIYYKKQKKPEGKMLDLDAMREAKTKIGG